MNEPQAVRFDTLIDQFSPTWPDDGLRIQIRRRLDARNQCIVALDDDPTGTQTMHDIWVLTKWDERDLRRALADGEPALYILTNSRSLALEEAQALNRAIIPNLINAARAESRPITVVSRSDSTLRGHFPGELTAIADALTDLGEPSFDGVCIIPFFPEGGRYTAHDVHWVREGEWLKPASDTPYSKDPVFGYSHSYLPDWIEEKTEGHIHASDVQSITLELIRKGGPAAVKSQLLQIPRNAFVVVNALDYRDLEVFVVGMMQAEDEGKRFLFRTAASFVKVAAGLFERPLLQRGDLLSKQQSEGGLIVVGSHVPKTTAQLEVLRTINGLQEVELPVQGVLHTSERNDTVREIAGVVDAALSIGKDVVIYTSRQVVKGETPADSLAISQEVSRKLMDVVKHLQVRPRYVIGKGGITSSDLATEAMQVQSARVLGQIHQGVPVWKLGPQSRWPAMPYVVFPGNVGEDDTLARIVKMLRG